MEDSTPTDILKVLSEEERQQKIQEAKKEARAKTVTKVFVRAVAFNWDVVALVTIIVISTMIGYSFARILGLSAKEIATEASDYISLLFYILGVVVSCIANLSAKRGLIATALQRTIGQFFIEWIRNILEPKTELKWNVLTSQSTDEEHYFK